MNVDLWICSLPRDYQWLDYCLRSIEKYFTGWRRIHVAIPPRVCRPANWANHGRIDWHAELLGFRSGYVCQQLTKMLAFQECDADYLCFVDSDHVCVTPTDVAHYFDAGRPQIWARTFADVRRLPDGTEGVTAAAAKWQQPAEAALGFPCPWFTLEFLPIVYHRETLRRCAEHVQQIHGKPLVDYGREVKHPGFGEFLVLGNWIICRDPDQYSIRHLLPGQSIEYRFFGHSPYVPISAERRRWLEELLS